MLRANLVVMEIKVNERVPHWLTDMIAAHNLQLARFSKYCRSIEAAQNMPSTQQCIPVAECAEDVLASCLSPFRTLERKMGIRRRQTAMEEVEVSDGHFQHPRSDQ
jgi:hypothetical protein